MPSWEDLIAEAKENGYASVVVPDDNYEVEVTAAKLIQKNGKKDCLWVKSKIEGGPYDGDSLNDNLYVDLANAGLMKIIMSKLLGYGITFEFLEGLKGRFGALSEPTKADHLKAIAAQLPGKRAVVKVTTSEYQGKPKNDVFAQYPLTDEAKETTTPATSVMNEVDPELPI